MLSVAPSAVKFTQAPDFVSPFILGQMDAEEGNHCLPGNYYVMRSQCVEYAHGYESVAGPCLLSVEYTHSVLPVVLTDADIEAHYLDLVDGIDTDNSHRMMMAGF